MPMTPAVIAGSLAPKQSSGRGLDCSAPLAMRAPARIVRSKIHSSLGGRKAHLNFELKDAPEARGLRPSQILDFKVQLRSGLPCDEWRSMARL